MAAANEDLAQCPLCRSVLPIDGIFGHVQACQTASTERRLASLSGSVTVDPAVAALLVDSEWPEYNIGSCSHASQIQPGLYLGSVSAALDGEWLRTAGVGCIVNCASEIERPAAVLEALALPDDAYICTGMEDTSLFDGYAAIVRGADAIHAAREAGKTVLVHCAVGRSRSATTVIAFLVKHRGMPLLEAASTVKAARSLAFPNLGFWRLLLHLEVDVHGAERASIPAGALALHPESQYWD